MKELILFECQKVWKKRLFLYLVIGLLLFNVIMLWYNNHTESNVPLKAYQSVSHDMEGLNNDERLAFIKDYYDEIIGIYMVEQTKIYESYHTDSGDRMAQDIKTRQKDIYEKYYSRWEEGKYLKYTDDIVSEEQYAEELYHEFEMMSGYEAYLSEIEGKAETLSGISIFGNTDDQDKFSSRNIEKTARDYAAVHGTPITYDLSKGIKSATDSFTTDIIAILFLFILASILIFEEKEKGLLSLTKTTSRGKQENISAKLISLAVNTLVISILLYGSNIIYMAATVGLGDLSRSIQSVFTESTFQISVWEYLLFFILTKWITVFVVGLVIILVSIFARHSSIIYLSCAGLFVGCYLIYQWIPATSDFNWLKYCNLMGLMKVNHLYGEYLNLNLFRHPISLLAVSLITLSLCLIIFTTLTILGFCKKRNMTTAESPIKKLVHHISLFRYKPSGNLTKHEGYKVLITNKAFILIVLFLALTIYQYSDKSVYLSVDELYYKSYMLNLQGDLTEEKVDYLEKEQARFVQIQTEMDDVEGKRDKGEINDTQAQYLLDQYQKERAAEDVFQTIWKRYEYVKENKGASFVYDSGYKYLFDLSGKLGMQAALQIIFMLILCFSAVFAMEYKSGAWRILSTTPKGKADTIRRKLIICSLCVGVILMITEVPTLLTVSKYFGFGELSASAKSIPELSGLPAWISIWGYLLILLLIKLLVSLMILVIVLVLSQIMKNSLYTMLLSTLLLGAPVLMAAMGITVMRWFSALPLFQTNFFIQQENHFIFYVFYLIISIVIIVTGSYYLMKKFGSAE